MKPRSDLCTTNRFVLLIKVGQNVVCWVIRPTLEAYLALFSATWGGSVVGGGGGARPSDSLSLLSSCLLVGGNSPSRCEGTPRGGATIALGRCGLANRRFSWLASVTYLSLWRRRRRAGVQPVRLFSSSVELADISAAAFGSVAQRFSTGPAFNTEIALRLVAKRPLPAILTRVFLGALLAVLFLAKKRTFVTLFCVLTSFALIKMWYIYWINIC